MVSVARNSATQLCEYNFGECVFRLKPSGRHTIKALEKLGESCPGIMRISELYVRGDTNNDGMVLDRICAFPMIYILTVY